MLIKIGREKWIHKYCATGKHYVVATPNHFRVENLNLVATCKGCEAREQQHMRQREAELITVS